MRKEIKDFKEMKEINEAGKKTLNSLRSLLSLSSLYTPTTTPPPARFLILEEQIFHFDYSFTRFFILGKEILR